MTESDQFERALDRLIQDESPAPNASNLDHDEQQMLQMAQLIRGSSQTSAPDKQFAEGLARRLNETRPGRSISRRTAVVSGLGAVAAGILGGLGIERSLNNPSKAGLPPEGTLVGAGGHWTHVAHLNELPDGAVKSFTTGSIAGFLIHRNGRLMALSRVCTHMGCLLTHEAAGMGFVCPCHGAQFSIKGDYLSGTYEGKLPPLPKLKVRVQDTSIQVWSA